VQRLGFRSINRAAASTPRYQPRTKGYHHEDFATTAIAAVALASLAAGVGLAQPKPDQSIAIKQQTSGLKTPVSKFATRTGNIRRCTNG
jgi:hypothetical protein